MKTELAIVLSIAAAWLLMATIMYNNFKNEDHEDPE